MFSGEAVNSKPIKNHTDLYPTASDVFKHLIDQLIALSSDGWIHFYGLKKDAWVEVANDRDYLLLNLSYPFKKDIDRVFQEAGVFVPGIWDLKRCSPRRLGGLVGGSAVYSIPQNQSSELIAFIDNLFVKFYACGQDYPVTGYSVNL